jgi:type 1 fimbriae regulatory protein FimB/type 1 fimbriae regulatory protein FimE
MRDVWTDGNIGSAVSLVFSEEPDTMPTTVLRTVVSDGQRVRPKPPGRRSNAESGRSREYLTPAEVDKVIKAARKRGRYGQRDALAIMMAYRHGLRVSELVGLRWSQVNFKTARLTVHRVKNSEGGTHPILGDEMRELRKLERDQKETGGPYPHIFVSERGGAPVSVDWFKRMIKRVGAECDMPLVHPHMLRHSAGFALADKGRDVRDIQDFLGHKYIQNTVGYTRLRPSRFDRIWD